MALLSAPAGYGKIILLVVWAKQASLPVAWLNIDHDDNDLNRFFRYLIGALQTVEIGLGEEALDFIQSTRGSGLEIGLTWLINEILSLSSILELLTGPLCEEVVLPEPQPGCGAVMPSRLEQVNLFITALDERHEWFRYHHLFADFLRHIPAENNTAEIPVLQKRAALWFEKNSNRIDSLAASTDMIDIFYVAVTPDNQ